MKDTEVADDRELNLVDDLAALVDRPRHRPGPKCGVAVALARLADRSPEFATKTQEAIDNPTVSASALSSTLANHGVTIAPGSLLRHRRRSLYNGCRCDA